MMVTEKFRKDVDIATDFILSVEAEADEFDEVLLRELDKSDLTDSQKRIVKSSMF